MLVYTYSSTVEKKKQKAFIVLKPLNIKDGGVSSHWLQRMKHSCAVELKTQY